MTLGKVKGMTGGPKMAQIHHGVKPGRLKEGGAKMAQISVVEKLKILGPLPLPKVLLTAEKSWVGPKLAKLSEGVEKRAAQKRPKFNTG